VFEEIDKARDLLNVDESRGERNAAKWCSLFYVEHRAHLMKILFHVEQCYLLW